MPVSPLQPLLVCPVTHSWLVLSAASPSAASSLNPPFCPCPCSPNSSLNQCLCLKCSLLCGPHCCSPGLLSLSAPLLSLGLPLLQPTSPLSSSSGYFPELPPHSYHDSSVPPTSPMTPHRPFLPPKCLSLSFPLLISSQPSLLLSASALQSSLP